MLEFNLRYSVIQRFSLKLNNVVKYAKNINFPTNSGFCVLIISATYIQYKKIKIIINKILKFMRQDDVNWWKFIFYFFENIIVFIC